MKADEIRERAIGSAKWVYLQNIIPRLLQPLITIVLARLLNPSVYGLVAIASTAISLFEIFRDMGMSRALIQSEEDENIVSNVVFWSSILFGFITYIILFLSAPWIAHFFHNSEAISVLRVLGFQLVIASFGSVHRNILVRRIEFRRIFLIDLLPNLIPLVITIPLASVGFGVWALVLGSITASTLSTALLWLRVPWRPKFHFNLAIGRRVLVFGFLSALEASLGWFYVSGDNVIVGHYLSVAELGLYTISYNLVVMVLGMGFAPITSITYPVFSRLQHDKTKLRDYLIKIMRLSALISLPIGVGISLVAHPVVIIVFGDKWIGMANPLSVLAVVQALAFIVTANPDLYRAVGRPDIMPKFQILKLLYTIPAYILGAQYGLMAFCYTKLVVVLIGLPLHLILAREFLHFEYRILYDCFRTPFLCATSMAVVVILIQYIMRSVFHFIAWPELLVSVFVGCISFGAILRVLDPALARQVVRLGFKVLGR